ncbi:hypothetical protein [Pontixanthobacter luteolus]|uniref:hypothetical protein n=1 Tax=Pontixanthobacter luteolus TaxID=295089 RepID=UPI0019274955|nr:hypothetical protein [Pontixanthobacter luteolus]
MRTRQRICAAKRRYPTREDAREAAEQADVVLRAYHCDRCFGYHLTSRIRAGK